ncbi:MAG TPA: hypothetical protein VGO53_01025 [Steroidobacteraceae bacterium]|jgi:hypothetical protein|nr:hypothetical protein [Steroidobacteraceae bacterium]
MKLKSLVLCVSLLASGMVIAQAPPAPSPEMQAARQAMLKACDADIKSTCAGKEGREVGQCLRTNNDKLSAGCKDAMSKMPRPAAPAQ